MEGKLPKSEIAGVQTVMPAKVTQHRKTRAISAGERIFRRSLSIVLYYRRCNGDADSGWLVAGWIKESLGRALAEQPMLSGRLRRRRTAEEDGGALEVVANDSGVRLVEAKIPATLSEFVELLKTEGAKAEAETLFWRDIDEDDPQFSPLFYVQVTNFECGGYSVGISCSIILADLILGTDFLRKWSDIQTSLLQATHHTTQLDITPIFYLPTLKQDIAYLSALSTSLSLHDHLQPAFFLAKSATLDVETCEKLALSCVGEDLDGRTGPDVFLFAKEKGDSGDVKLEIRSGYRAKEKSVCDCDCDWEARAMHLEETGLSKVSFWGGKRPSYSSCKIGSVSEGLVLVLPTPCAEDISVAKVIVAMPQQKFAC